MRLLSWNMLAQNTIKREQYPKASNICLKKRHRKPLILSAIKSKNADLMTLQEIEIDIFESLLSSLELDGYFEQKHNSSNGCAIFWDSRFKMIKKFREPLLPFRHIWEHDNSFLMGVVLEKDGIQFLLCTTHLYFHRLADYAKLRGMIGCLSVLKAYKDIPIVFAGDFNSTPDTSVYRLATCDERELHLTPIQKKNLEESYREGLKRSVINEDILSIEEIGDKSVKELWRFANYLDLPKFKSVYSEFLNDQRIELNSIRIGNDIYRNNMEEKVLDINGDISDYISEFNEPLYTNYCFGFKACIDYIFIRNVKINSYFRIPNENELGSGLPNDVFPSDHLIIGTDFEI
eukprot:NODE_182_length_15748_cov_0.173174.p4 type:complete len:347 gc:universal NODE_182_length_15748_cov_0.173174:7924-6884(-)